MTTTRSGCESLIDAVLLLFHMPSERRVTIFLSAAVRWIRLLVLMSCDVTAAHHSGEFIAWFVVLSSIFVPVAPNCTYYYSNQYMCART